ncbi:MAG: hypothetical protein KTR24_16630, partial [Saprospiraceae bacterium]|nr:hypothetical protein [Saprospiraceae bacterium]
LSEAGLGFRSIDGGGLPIFESLVNREGFSLNSTSTSFRVGHFYQSTAGNGAIDLLSDRGLIGHEMGFTTSSNGAALYSLYGNNGALNVRIGAGGTANVGAITIHNTSGVAKAQMFVDGAGDGIVLVDDLRLRTRSTSRSSSISYMGILHGPEVASYLRGTATLVDGETIVTLPNSFTSKAQMDDMTIILTPLHWDTYGLAVVEKSATGFKVKELKGGEGNFKFDWEVKSKRSDIDQEFTPQAAASQFNQKNVQSHDH